MWYRRPLRFFQRQFIRRQMQPTPIDPRLIEAHHLFEIGNYEQAAKLFEELAYYAEEHQKIQSPFLYLQAGSVWIKTSKIEQGIENIKKGLSILIERQKWGQLKRISNAILTRLKNNGLGVQANELNTWLSQQIPGEIKQLPLWKNDKFGLIMKTRLPSHCPSCGGPVNLNEIDLSNANLTNCAYCGNILTSE